ncbi:MAG: TonB-dependent receptor [Candidatus Latescibacterota bacterium]
MRAGMIVGFLILWAAPLWAIQTGRIVGRVTDADTGESLAGAVVLLPGTNLGAIADTSGYFRMEGVPAGMVQVEARMVGYAPSARVNLRVEAGKVVAFSLSLVPIRYKMKEVSVIAERLPFALAERSPVSLRVIRAAEFEHRVTSVSELLSEAGGVQIKTSGGLGSYSTVSIRGSSSEQVNVYLDGVLLNSTLGGGVDVGNIPLSHVERVEVYKGATPVELGGEAIGGAINIVTQSPDRRRVGIGAFGGTFGTAKANWILSEKKEKLGLLFAMDYVRSDNNFRFLDDNGTRYNQEDDTWMQRRNNDFQGFNAIGKIDYALRPSATLILNNNFYCSDKGIPGIGSFQSKSARFRTLRNLTEGSLILRQVFERMTFRLKGVSSYYAGDYRDLENEVGLGRQDNHNVTRTVGGELHIQTLLWNHQILSGVLRGSTEGFKPTDRMQNTFLLDNKRASFSAALEDEILLWGDRLSIVPSGQWDVLFSEFIGDGHWIEGPARKQRHAMFSRRLGVRFKAASWMVLKANVAKSYRAPSFYELFGDKGSVIGNTNLTPEEGLNRDVGCRVSGKQGSSDAFLEVSYYDNRLRDAIQFIQHSQNVSRPENIGRAQIRGLECAAGANFFHHLMVGGNLTRQDAQNMTELYGGIYLDKWFPNKPRYEGSGRIEVSDERWGKLFYEVSATGKNYHDLYNKFPVPKRVLHNVGITVFGARSSFHITVEGKNLTDNQVADLWGYPLPGRAYHMGVRGSL